MQEELFVKIAIPIVGIILTAIIGGRLFFALAKHFLVKYFDEQFNSIRAAFKRIDELRKELREFKQIDFRDYKRDVAIEFTENKDAIKELYKRTDNHAEVKKCVEFCDQRNKLGAS